jgi:hypothetical protein
MAIDSKDTFSQKPVKDFKRAFDRYYADNSGNFYVRTNFTRRGICGNMADPTVLVNIPRLDSATLREDGMYLIDKNKVICKYPNSDGGNFVEIKGVDPGTFKVYKNVFGGRDKDHVFSEDKMLEGIDPGRVKVYSDTKNCANCTGYFQDSVLVDFMGRKVDKVPEGYVFAE